MKYIHLWSNERVPGGSPKESPQKSTGATKPGIGRGGGAHSIFIIIPQYPALSGMAGIWLPGKSVECITDEG